MSTTSFQLDTHTIDSCIGPHTTSDPRPSAGEQRCITMGVNQGLKLNVVVNEWFFSGYGQNINTTARCKNVYHSEFKSHNGWQRLDELMREWQILHCVVDAHPETMEARRFAQRFPSYVTLCSYRHGISGIEIDQQNPTQIAVDRSRWLDYTVHRFLSNGGLTLPKDVASDYKEHMQNLIRVSDTDEESNWPIKYISEGQDSYAHAHVYAEVALPFAVAYKTGQDIASFL